MKQLFTLLILLFVIGTCGFANPKSQDQLKTRIEQTNQLKQKAFAILSKTGHPSNLKSVLINSKMLDKISYPDGSYKTFAYNEAGQLIDYKFHEYDSWDEKTLLREQLEYQYDSEGNQTLFVDYYLDSFDGFIVKEKEEASFQSNNIPLEEVSWEYSDSEKTLIKIGKSVYTVIDENHIIIENFRWDTLVQDWKLSSKIEIEYTDYDHPSSMTSFNYDSKADIFRLESSMEFKYNSNGQEIEMITKFVPEDTDELIVASTLVTEYNTNGDKTRETESGDYMGTTYVSFDNIYTYENGLLIKEENNGMFGSTYSEFSYTDGKLSEKREYYEEYNDNFEVTGFSLQYKYQFVYNKNIKTSELAYPADLDTYYSSYREFCEPFYFDNGALDYTICASWDYMSESVIEKYRGTYNYANFKAGIQDGTSSKELTQSVLTFGPNPCTNTLQIFPSNTQEVDFTIYNTNGQSMHQTKCEGTCTIDISTWNKGLYFIHTQSTTYKFLKN